MNSKQRLYAALKGEKVDRPPIAIGFGFNFGSREFKKAGSPSKTSTGFGFNSIKGFTDIWQSEELFQEVCIYSSKYTDPFCWWGIGEYLNRFLVIPPEYVHQEEPYLVDEETVQVDSQIDTPGGVLTFANSYKKGISTSWNIKHPVENIEDLEKLSEVPFSFDATNIEKYIGYCRATYREIGDRAIMQFFVPSPIVTISATMSFENFLLMSITQNKFFHRLLEEITNRELIILDAIFKDNDIDTIVTLGGSEQCTPPMMAPQAFDEFVVPYDGKIIKRLKEHRILVDMHSHGKVKYALEKMVEMGLDSTNPVEPPPQGDVTYTEAREIVGDKLTLIGNFELNELENADAEYIRNRVKDILSLGKERLIFGAADGPMSSVSRKLVNNYITLFESIIEYSA